MKKEIVLDLSSDHYCNGVRLICPKCDYGEFVAKQGKNIMLRCAMCNTKIRTDGIVISQKDDTEYHILPIESPKQEKEGGILFVSVNFRVEPDARDVIKNAIQRFYEIYYRELTFKSEKGKVKKIPNSSGKFLEFVSADFLAQNGFPDIKIKGKRRASLVDVIKEVDTDDIGY